GRVPVLDDSALRVSAAHDLDTVPTVVQVGPDGQPRRRFVGFDRLAWQELLDDLAARAGAERPAVDWSAYPAMRPGCGARHVEPPTAGRRDADTRGERLGSRRIETAEALDPFEFMSERGLTDGLPVVPPTPERVLRMLAATRREPDEVVAVVPPNMGP